MLFNSSAEFEYSEYENMLESNRQKTVSLHLQKFPNTQDYQIGIFKKGFESLKNVEINLNEFQFSCEFLVKREGKSAFGKLYYEPTVFIGTTKISIENKLELAFLGVLLEQIQKNFPAKGLIVNKNGLQQSVEISRFKKQIKTIIFEIQEFDKTPPKLILNKHCSACQFQKHCREQAIKEDNLSLLNRVTGKQISKLEKKGIFTVKQLSFIYKPRRKGKRTKNPPSLYKPELQALAIRTEKIYIQKLPSFERKQVEIFLDIEGLPDDSFYYLFGFLIVEDNIQTYKQFWADTPKDEEEIWREAIRLIESFPESPIFHYGSFEPSTFEKLSKRYQTNIEAIKNRFVNVNTFIYGKIYFPTYSNGLKDLGAFLGVKWTNEKASGLQSIVWRNRWEEGQESYKNELLTYNREDCLALKILTDELTRIQTTASASNDVDFVNEPKKLASEIGERIHNQFNSILNFAHFDYDKKKINFNQESEKQPKQKRIGVTFKPSKITKRVVLPPQEFCNIHTEGKLVQTTKEVRKIIADINFSENGVRKSVIEYVSVKSYCKLCKRTKGNDFFKGHSIYGHNLKAWILYQRIALQLSYYKVEESLEALFGKDVSCSSSYGNFTMYMSNFHIETENKIISKLLESPSIHADETTINIRGVNQYVWVFTTDKHVVFRLSPNREATLAQEFLKDYQGVVISDFFPAYDSLDCPQQKCWVHLIRDLNNGLWNSPFDKEFENFVSEVRNLIVPIIQSVHKYGLKKRHLAKHQKQVDRFYRKHINNKFYKSENCNLFQKRFIRYQVSLFNFINHNGVNWQNNTAERALRHICTQRKISGTFFESLAPHYLRLVGIMQTCRFQGKSFWKFLLSKEKDIDQFGKRKRKS